MEPVSSTRVTEMLKAWAEGDKEAADRLVEAVYPELRKIARGYMRREKAGQTLQTTALINEAYLRLAAAGASWQDRRHFFSVAAKAMRRILVDQARARKALKRGGGAPRAGHSTGIDFERVADQHAYRPPSLPDVDEALTRLAQIEPRRAEVVELRFFGGFSVEETAGILGISAQSVLRDWKLAKGWLAHALSR